MLELLVGILATWRIAAWLYYDGDAKWLKEAREQYESLSCFWCVTTRVGMALTPLLLWRKYQGKFKWLLFPFALSGGALLLTQAGRTIWRAMVEDR